MSLRWIQRGLAGIAIALGLGGAWWLHVESGVELSPQGLRGVVLDLGTIGPLLLVGIMTFRPFLVLPSGVVLFAAGLLFGSLGGTLYGAVGGTLGALLVFFIARALGRDVVRARLGERLEGFDDHLARRGPPWLGAYTAIPFSVLTPVFFTAGVTRMGAASFGVAAGLGFLPRAGLYTFLGQTASEPTRQSLIVASVLVVAVVAIVVLTRRYFAPAPAAGAPARGAARDGSG